MRLMRYNPIVIIVYTVQYDDNYGNAVIIVGTRYLVRVFETLMFKISTLLYTFIE